MSDNNDKLTTPLVFKHGASIKTRIAMSPMVINEAEENGNIGEDALNFYSMRSKVAGLIITGASYVSEGGKAYDLQIGADRDENIPGLKELAKALKKDGNKAILQLHHGGREAVTAQKLNGHSYAPSKMNFPWLDYTPEELTDAQIRQIIADFGAATTRAIEAGFDGVEIHGANHYLLQQFFSAYSNHRTDHWGGSLEKRMNFPLAVTDAVVDAAKDAVKDGFIIGYRISPEEIHGENVGYTIKDSLQLIDKIADYDIDYIHTSLVRSYDEKPQGGSESIGQLVKETVGDRAKTIIVANVFGKETAEKALDYGDIVAIGRQALIEPEFAGKILAGKSDEVCTSIAKGDVEKLGLKDHLIKWFTAPGSPLPPLPGQENL
ncbi:NADH-dependent flavin oxidoreductase [Secundilactobacillus hailunensis]|uniref:NADH-dependent flavin oxidoreductase n=1 Tax=Secundilactobacillus hailunensis TaxID=2559923 RepID=A0ABW1TCP0_9LACO|nr:NADH-dependent flavin oxidoreductase [Secundilactobacillus hailunensis]